MKNNLTEIQKLSGLTDARTLQQQSWNYTADPNHWPEFETTRNPDFQQTSSLLLPVTAKNLPWCKSQHVIAFCHC